MNNKSKADIVIYILKKLYPNASCSLKYSTPLQLLIATRLSAQCTDKRVNEVTPGLFSKYKNVYDFAAADINEVAQCIRSCGFYRVKSKDIVNMCKMIVENFDGKIPNNMEDMILLPGIGRKTANLVLGMIYERPGLIVDTHFIRITSRLGFHSSKDAKKVEKIMQKFIPPSESLGFCHRLVAHGRAVCKAINPDCLSCQMNNICDYTKSYAG